MGSDERIELLREIEEKHQCRLITYVCGDRPIINTRIAEDAIRPMYDHLRALPPYLSNKPERIALYLYSIGGVMETPWKMVTMLRSHCKEFHVLLPYKAYSAATMICLGADKILMTPKAELSPIDPSLTLASTPDKLSPFLLPELGVEDVSSYVTFLRQRAGLTDQSALSAAIGTLAQHLTPTVLGRIERIHSHIRLVARKLLSLCTPPLDDRRITAIVEALTEKVYVHGHGIGRHEAQEIGLQVEFLDGPLADLVWALFEDYEQELRLNSPTDPHSYFEEVGPDIYEEADYNGAYIESIALAHAFSGTWFLQRIRKIPAQPTININLQLNMPPGVQAEQLPQHIQQALQQLLSQGAQQLRQMVVQELARQAPVERLDGRFAKGQWRLVR